MHVIIDKVKGCYYLLRYQGWYSTGMPLLVFYLVIILLLWVAQKRKLEKAIFVYPLFLEILTIFNPLFVYFIAFKLGWSGRFYRFFWCVPIGIVIAYFCALLVNESKGVSHRKVLGLFLALIIIISFNHFIKLDMISPNIYKMQPEVIEIVELIRKEEGEKDVCAFYPSSLIPLVRQYDAGVISPVGRDDTPWTDEKVQRYFDEGKVLSVMAYMPVEVKKEEFLNALYENNVQYYVVKKGWISQEYRDSLNFKLLGATENYYVYQVIGL